MRIPTWGEVETKIRLELDLQDTDNFIGQDEMAGLGNDAVDSAEALIMGAFEDYFLQMTTLSLVQGTPTIALPSDIYGQKIRELVYKNGSRIYPLKRLKDPRMMYHKAINDYQATSLQEYEYFLFSPTAGAQDQLYLTPVPYESGAYLEMWYIRKANRIPLQAVDAVSRATQLATLIDIPEWRKYLDQYIKVHCYEKMKQFEMMKDAEGKLAVIQGQMMDALRDRMLDNETEVAQDTSHYAEHN